MVSKERLSRWVMYIGLVGLAGALMDGNPLTAVVGFIMFAQYLVVQFYSGYEGGGETHVTGEQG